MKWPFVTRKKFDDLEKDLASANRRLEQYHNVENKEEVEWLIHLKDHTDLFVKGTHVQSYGHTYEFNSILIMNGIELIASFNDVAYYVRNDKCSEFQT